MSKSAFVHLHCHSEFSLLDGACRLDKMIDRVAAMEMPAIALTDHGVMYGTLDFYTKCKAQGVQPILGVEAYMAPKSRKDRTKADAGEKNNYHMVLLARNLAGYKNLLKLTTIAALEGFYYKPRIDREVLESHAEGLIATTSCLGSEINQLLLKDDYNGAVAVCDYYANLLGRDNYYVELQDHGLPEQALCNTKLVQIASELKLPLICSNDVHYLEAEDANPHDVLLCIGLGTTVDDPKRMRYNPGFYLKSREEMAKLFPEYGEAIENTLHLAERCDVELEFGRCPLPSPGIPEGFGAQDYLRHLAEEGLPARFPKGASEEIRARMEYELGVIETTGFAQYILIVRDFAQFAAEKGIFYGVRGSAAGSLISYLIGITDIDPVAYGLTFERFLNPERVQMPDVDMDFEDGRRGEVIEYVTQKYGADHVAQIATFGTLASRACIKDVARVTGLDRGLADKLCNLVPTVPANTWTLEKTYHEIPEFQELVVRNPEAQTLFETAKRLEGLTRHASVHAAGVIISHDPLVEHTPLQRGADGGLVTQYVAANLEKIGLLKMDFLGLINYSIVGTCLRYIEKTTGERLDISNIPLDDPRTYELLGNGECVGVFQLESPQMRRYIQELKPTSVHDLAAMVALYRPGPMAHIPQFIRGKHGQEKVTYPHPSVESILKETYGVIVYQDQVMQISQAIAGFSLGKADILRRAMGKKKKEDMDKAEKDFLSGAEANGIPAKTARAIFDLIIPFSGYAFNKAHATCYAMLAYQTAYLKANYPVAYMAAYLACFADKTDKLKAPLEECKRLGIAVLPPDINASDAEFTVAGASIRFGLAALKGIGRGPVEQILRIRQEGGPFRDLADFIGRVCAGVETGVTKSSVELLIQCGAFDTLMGPGKRRAMVAVVEKAVASAQRLGRERANGQGSLLDMLDEEESASPARVQITLPAIPEYPKKQLLGFERDLMGLFISEHPLEAHAGRLARAQALSTAQVREVAHQTPVTVGGILAGIKPYTSKKSKEPMAFLDLEDQAGTIACTVFPKTYQKVKEALQKDWVVLVQGKTSHRERVREGEDEGQKNVEIVVDEITVLSEGIGGEGTVKEIHLRLPAGREELLPLLADALGPHRVEGGAALYCHVAGKDGEYRIKTGLKAAWSEALRTHLLRLAGGEGVWTE